MLKSAALIRPLGLATLAVLFTVTLGAGGPGKAGSPAASPAAPSSVAQSPVDSLSGARHHAVEMPLINFYAVWLPRDFDPSGKKKYPLCVILHGSGSTEVGHGTSLSGTIGLDDIIYIAPRAPYPSFEVFLGDREPGWTAWPEFPEAWGHPGEAGFPDGELQGLDPIRLYADWIARCVLDAKRRYPVEGKAVVVGHSQGAGFAQYFAALHPELVKAYAAYAGSYWRSLENDSAALALKAGGVHPFIAHSEGDSVVKVEESRTFVAYLEKHSVPHTKAFYTGGGHDYSAKADDDLRNFVSKWCQGRPAPKRKGLIYIQGLARNSKADSAGLKAGDRIVAYDGKTIRTRDEYMSAVKAAEKAAEKAAKAEVRLSVERGGKVREVAVRPGRLGIWLAER